MDTHTTAVAGLVEQLAREIHAETALAGLSAGQWAILRYLEKAGLSARGAKHISRYLGDSDILVLRNLTALARRMLVVFSAEAVAAPVSLTDRGRKVLANDPVTRLAKAIEAIPAADQRALGRLVETIYDVMVTRDA